jgi:hypothetical protein
LGLWKRITRPLVDCQLWVAKKVRIVVFQILLIDKRIGKGIFEDSPEFCAREVKHSERERIARYKRGRRFCERASVSSACLFHVLLDVETVVGSIYVVDKRVEWLPSCIIRRHKVSVAGVFHPAVGNLSEHELIHPVSRTLPLQLTFILRSFHVHIMSRMLRESKVISGCPKRNIMLHFV